MPKLTPLYPRTSALCHSQRWQLWEDYLIADSYNFSIAEEYFAIRNTVAIFDFSPLYVYHFTGRDALPVINRIVTRDMRSCSLQGARYTAWCNEKGKVIDDGVVIRLDENTWQITANTDNMSWFGSFINKTYPNVNLEDASSNIVTIPVQGPLSVKVLQLLCADDVDPLNYFGWMKTKINKYSVGLSRTGYTGDLGYEIWCKKENALSVWDNVMDVGKSLGITPSGFGALDIARIEAGLIWCGYDYRSANLVSDAESSLPWELNLDWVVDTQKSDFVGKQALIESQHAADISIFTGFVMSIENSALSALMQRELSFPWRRPRKLVTGTGEYAGCITSGAASPALNALIALGKIQKKHLDKKLYMEVITDTGAVHYILTQRTTLPFLSVDRKRRRLSPSFE